MSGCSPAAFEFFEEVLKQFINVGGPVIKRNLRRNDCECSTSLLFQSRKMR